VPRTASIDPIRSGFFDVSKGVTVDIQLPLSTVTRSWLSPTVSVRVAPTVPDAEGRMLRDHIAINPLRFPDLAGHSPLGDARAAGVGRRAFVGDAPHL